MRYWPNSRIGSPTISNNARFSFFSQGLEKDFGVNLPD